MRCSLTPPTPRARRTPTITMAHAAADPKAAPLADDLKEFARYVSAHDSCWEIADSDRSLQQNVFPKTFFCTLDNQLAIDSYKLLCCNKAICPSCKLARSCDSNIPPVLRHA